MQTSLDAQIQGLEEITEGKAFYRAKNLRLSFQHLESESEK
jgi:hypothetical protein